jgi:hypothetical protein
MLENERFYDIRSRENQIRYTQKSVLDVNLEHHFQMTETLCHQACIEIRKSGVICRLYPNSTITFIEVFFSLSANSSA